MSLLLRGIRCVLLAAVAPAAFAADLSDQRMEALFKPFLADRVTLSPDGRFLAYSEHSGTDVTVKILDLDQPGSPKTVIVQEDRIVLNSTERVRASLRFLRWTEGNRLVFAPTIYSAPVSVALSSVSPEVLAAGFSPPPPVIVAPIMAVDADGRNPRTLVQNDDFDELSESAVDGAPPDPVQRRNHILGFAAGRRDRLLVALPSVRESDVTIPSGVYEVNVHNGNMTKVNEDGAFGSKHFDRSGQPRLMAEGGTARHLELTYRYQTAGSSRWRMLTGKDEGSELAGFRATPASYYGARSLPLGFAFDRDVLIFASNVGRDTFGVYGLDLRTMTRSSLMVEHPYRDLVPLEFSLPSPALVLDEARQVLAGIRAYGDPPLTVWLDTELAEAQRAFDVQFPRRSVEILEWNDARTRFLLNVSGGTEPGRLYVFKRNEGVLTEISRRAPWLTTASLHETRPVVFPGPDGSTLSGFLTRPRTPRITPMPLVIAFAPGFPATPHEEFDREAQVLADMGLAVLRLNQRGVLGRGLHQREAMRAGADLAAAADARAAIEWVAARMPVDRKRVVAMGQGFGGYLALRSAQLAPELFRCVFTTEPVVEPAALVRPDADLDSLVSFSQEANRLFLEGASTALYRRGVVSSGDAIQHPSFVVYRGYLSNDMTRGVARLRGQLKRHDLAFETVDVREDYFNGMAKARGKVYRDLEQFLNLNLYNYDVKLGQPRVKP